MPRLLTLIVPIYAAALAYIFSVIYKDLSEDTLMVITTLGFSGVVVCIMLYSYGIFRSTNRLKAWLEKGYLDYLSMIPSISFAVSLTILFYIMDI